MCLIVFSFQEHKNYPLIVAANRDEFYERKTKPLDIWEENESIIAGRDLQSGGTWMGVNKITKRFAAITNYRDPSRMNPDAKSRGFIVSSYIESSAENDDFIQNIRGEKNLYNGFNFIYGNFQEIYHYSNISDEVTKIKPGLHAVSNHLLNTPWPKVLKAKKDLDNAFKDDSLTTKSLEALKNDSVFPDKDLPDTGMGLEWERMLSPLFVKSEVYGTRSSSVVIFDKNRNISFTERAYLEKGLIKETNFKIK